METYTINKINDDGSVDVTFSIDGKKQNISGLPVGDAEKLDLALCNYGVAYADGLNKEGVVVADDSKDLVGKEKEVKLPDNQKA